MVLPTLSARIDPTPENGCTKICFALSALVAGRSKLRIRATESRSTEEPVARIRRQVAAAIGLG